MNMINMRSILEISKISLFFRQSSIENRLAWGLVPACIVDGIGSRFVCDTHQSIACGPVFFCFVGVTMLLAVVYFRQNPAYNGAVAGVLNDFSYR